MQDAGVTITLKSKHRDGPWLVIKADDIAGCGSLIEAAFGPYEDPMMTFPEVILQAQAMFWAQEAVVFPSTEPLPPHHPHAMGSGQVPAQRSQETSRSSQGPSPDCPHGPRTYKSGQGAKGPWGGWFCQGPRNQQCDPLWDKR